MTATTIDAVGFCAHYSLQGDWAFEFALALARRTHKKLNIFHFLSDPYSTMKPDPSDLSRAEYDRLLIEREKELRFYYDDRLGDYLDAGFRLCEDDEWTELHRCLCKREFQVLVLGVPSREAVFGGRPVLDFAASFVCPVVLVGPESREIQLNCPAALLSEKLGLENGSWRRIDTLLTASDRPGAIGSASQGARNIGSQSALWASLSSPRKR
jgi:hypothetical protein